MTPYDDLKARAQKALDTDDFGALRGLFVDMKTVAAPAPATPYPAGGSAQTQDSGNNGPPPQKPPVQNP